MTAVRILAILIAALSLIALYQAGFEPGPFVPPLQFLVDLEDSVAQALFQWAEPPLQATVAWVNKQLGWNLSLLPHWKHVVVLLWLYFGGGAKKAWRRGYRSGAVFRFAWGGVIATLAGALFGVVPLDTAEATAVARDLPVGGRIGMSLLSALIPVLAVVVYSIGTAAWVASAYDREGKTWRRVFSEGAGVFPVIYGLAGVASVLFALVFATRWPLASFVETLPNPGLLLLMALTVGLALFLQWSDRLLDRKDNLGLIMLEAYFGAISFIAVDAGWKLAAV